MKKVKFIIPLVVYPFDVMVMLGFSNKECENELNNLGFNQEDIELALFETDTVQGRAVMFSTNETLIRLRNKPKNEVQFGELQHENFTVSHLL